MNPKQNPPRVSRWDKPRQNFDKTISDSDYSIIRAGNLIVGKVQGDQFIKKVKGSTHFLRKPPAIAFDIQTLEEAHKAGATSVRVIDTETGKIYQTPIATIFKSGFEFNRGHGDQIGLSFQFWQTGNRPLATQLDMWGGKS